MIKYIFGTIIAFHNNDGLLIWDIGINPAIKKEDKMLIGVACLVIGSIAVLATACFYLKQMSDEMLE